MWPDRGSRPGSVGCRSRQSTEYSQPVAEQSRSEELLAYVLLAGTPELLAELGLAKYLEGAVRALLGGRDQVTGLAALPLRGDAPHVPPEEGPPLPQRLRDGESEALARELLDHSLGLRLE